MNTWVIDFYDDQFVVYEYSDKKATVVSTHKGSRTDFESYYQSLGLCFKKVIWLVGDIPVLTQTTTEENELLENSEHLKRSLCFTAQSSLELYTHSDIFSRKLGVKSPTSAYDVILRGHLVALLHKSENTENQVLIGTNQYFVISQDVLIGIHRRSIFLNHEVFLKFVIDKYYLTSDCTLLELNEVIGENQIVEIFKRKLTGFGDWNTSYTNANKKAVEYTSILKPISVWLVTVILLSIVGWLFVGTYFQYEANNKKGNLKDKWSQFEDIQMDIQELKSSNHQLLSLMTNRSQISDLIDIIENAKPERLWFNTYQYQSQKLKIEGYSHEEEYVSILLKQLEQQERIQSVNLKFTELIPSKHIHRKTGIYPYSNSLYFFHIEVEF